jgi:aminoglycoside/choline kinase family phosphotransferase
MEEKTLISDLYFKYSDRKPSNIDSLPGSGSERKYFRISDNGKTVIAAFNRNEEENRAFIGFSKHFISKNLKVPEIFEYFPQKYVYFLQDLGDTNLYTYIQTKNKKGYFDEDLINLYKKVLDNLIVFQTEGIKGLDIELCYPHKSFDNQSMMWDMNYFKYMFLKLVGTPFNEKRLEHDFKSLADHLLEADQNFFLYRDFQSANIMIMNGEPWFIDYQGGRHGAPQYDVASLIYDAKAHIPMEVSQRLLKHYKEKYSSATGNSIESFSRYFSGFSIIRLMQALGAFGFRGLYENKPTFTESLVPAVKLILQIIESDPPGVNVPELVSTLKSVPFTDIYKRLNNNVL